MNENINQMNATYLEFWNWFEKNEKDFFNEVKNHEKIEEKFLDIVLPKLQEINENFYILTGMCDDSTAELIVTVDGNIKQIVYAEDFINTAPRLENWKFTALKPETDIENVNIKMGDFHFNNDDQNKICLSGQIPICCRLNRELHRLFNYWFIGFKLHSNNLRLQKS